MQHRGRVFSARISPGGGADRCRLGADVDVWAVRLDVGGEQLDWARRLLPADERPDLEGANPLHRARALRRAWLRSVLGRYVGDPPAALELRRGAHGKPRLAAAAGLHFNMTSTRHRAFIAVASAPVGVDAEHEGDLPPYDVRLPCDEREEGEATFVQRWTCFEAFTKAVGCGVAGDRLDVTVGWADGVPSLTRIRHDDPRVWTLTTERLDDGTVLSLAVRAPDARHYLRTPQAHGHRPEVLAHALG